MKSEFQTIMDGNELIARFMCGKSRRVIWCVFPDGTDVQWKFLKYHSSWDALMPVIKKISTIRIVHNEKSDLFDIMGQGFYEVDINKCWLAVVEMIKWHNKNK